MENYLKKEKIEKVYLAIVHGKLKYRAGKNKFQNWKGKKFVIINFV